VYSHSRPSTYDKINTKLSCSGLDSRIESTNEGGPKLIVRSNTRRHRSRRCSRSLTIAIPLPPVRHTAHHYAIGKKRTVHWSAPSGPFAPHSTARRRRWPCASSIAVGLAAAVPYGDERDTLTSADGGEKKFKSGARLRRARQLRAAPRTQGMRSLRYESRRIGGDMARAQMARRECSGWPPEELPFSAGLEGQLCSSPQPTGRGGIRW